MLGKHKLGNWLFLALVLLAYGATGLAEPGLARQAWAGFVRMLGEVVPLLALVLVLMSLAERYLSPQRTRAWLGPDAGPRAWLLALVAGILSTGPIYPWYGLLAELRARGMRPALIAVMLYARAIKLPLLPLLGHYFGLRYAVVLSLSIAAFAILNGLAMDRLVPTMEAE